MHRCGNIQAVLAPDEFPLWVSPAEPGSVHDITAARAPAFPTLYPAAAAGLPAILRRLQPAGEDVPVRDQPLPR